METVVQGVELPLLHEGHIQGQHLAATPGLDPQQQPYDFPISTTSVNINGSLLMEGLVRDIPMPSTTAGIDYNNEFEWPQAGASDRVTTPVLQVLNLSPDALMGWSPNEHATTDDQAIFPDLLSPVWTP